MSRPCKLEVWMMRNGEEGEQFYSEKGDAHLTSLAYYCQRKIKTERLVAVTTRKENVKAKSIVRVTLLGKDKT